MLDLDGSDVSKLDFLVRIAEETVNRTGSVEVECRIGRFSPATTGHQPYWFQSGVTSHVFDRLVSFHSGHFQQMYTEFERRVYGPKRVDVFHLEDKSQKVVPSYKQKLEHVDLRQYQVRIAVSDERETQFTVPQTVPQRWVFVRRTSFLVSPHLRLDLSIVNNLHAPDNKPAYEVELEYILPFERDWFTGYIDAVGKLVSYFQNSDIISKQSDTENAKSYIVALFGARKISQCYGAQPRTLQRDDIKSLFTNTYAVTSKTDGTRAYVFVNSMGEVYLFQKDTREHDGVRMICIGFATDADGSKSLLSDYAGSLLEGEFTIEFEVFDILFHKDVDLRNSSDWHLQRRIHLAKGLVDVINKTTRCGITFKDYFNIGPDISLAKTCHDIIANNDTLEGLVFTPVDEPYPLGPSADDPQRSRIWDTLLKWKRPEDITIDFRYVVNETPDVECGLHVSILGKEVPFRPELFKKAHMLKNIRNMDEAVPHGSIIECRVFVEDTDLDIYFIRQRKDKESPNSMHVALRSTRIDH